MSLTSELQIGRKISTESKLIEWFCLSSQPKHEHLAAAHLRKMDGVEIFLPRIRFKRVTRQALTWVTEALFPGYLFARFNRNDHFRQVRSARGIREIVHFGGHWPTISESMIDELRQVTGTDEPRTLIPEFFPGDTVDLTDASLRGLRGIVSQVLPGRRRVEVLMEILGRETGVELSVDSLIRNGSERTALLRI